MDNTRSQILNYEERLDWIRLIRTENVGPATFHELLAHFGSAAAAIEALPSLGRRGGSRAPQQVVPRATAEVEWDAAERVGAKILSIPDAGYPPLLRQIHAPPPILFARGDTALASKRTVAIVGSRHASAIGRQLAANMAGDFGRAGITVVSGLARGIDTSAHKASIDTGTIAVIAGGINMIYPPENAALHEIIAEQGLLLCENPPGSTPRGQDFPRRNRIISGVSSGVVVVEAAKKSGSLITARLAGEQGRDVFAIPGHPLDPRAAGTNGLIRNGAYLATSADDVMTELFGTPQMSPQYGGTGFYNPSSSYVVTTGAPASDDELRQQVLEALSYTPVHPDILLRQTGLSSRSLAVAILELDLAGLIERHSNEHISLRADQFETDAAP
ncbi:MAG: DNA-processing protein DprA [Hyphomicrobiales bacterium]|nr:DNA-processing protein DprA [Hyphomicrobiales bacterium]